MSSTATNPPEHAAPTPTEKNNKRVLTGWAMFDWANSAFALVITVAIFPGYFLAITDDVVNVFGVLEISNSAFYSFAISLAYLIIVVVSPWLSGIADAGGRKMFFLKLFTTVGTVGCLALYWFKGMETLWLGTIGFILAMIGFAGGLVFYNSYLPEIATEDMYDKVSARGFAYGYIGSVTLLIINLIVILQPTMFGLPEEGTTPARLAFAMVGMWWIGFAQIPFRRLPPDEKNQEEKLRALAKAGWQEIKKVWRALKHQTQIKRFLASFFCYSMGVQTVLFLAATFAEKELAFSTSQLITVTLVLQIVAIGGAYAAAALSDRRGNVFSLATMLAIWIVVCFLAYFVTGQNEFYGIAALVGLVMGGIQSLSRSTYSKLIPQDSDENTSYFSFYDVLEKLAIVSGTFIFGLAEFLTGNIRNSVLVLSLFFIIGLVIVLRVRIREKMEG